MLTPKQKNQLKKYFSSQPVDVVYLFGSQATGKANKLSDLDFAVLFKEKVSKSRRFDLKIEYMGEIGHILKSNKVEVLDLKQAPISFRYAAIAPKNEIYIANRRRKVLFEAETSSRYFDQLYFIKQNTLYSLPSITNMK